MRGRGKDGKEEKEMTIEKITNAELGYAWTRTLQAIPGDKERINEERMEQCQKQCKEKWDKCKDKKTSMFADMSHNLPHINYNDEISEDMQKHLSDTQKEIISKLEKINE